MSERTAGSAAKRAPAHPVMADLMEAHYAEFRKIAHAVLRGRQGNCLQPTELAHEAAMRLVGVDAASIGGRTHFLSLSARMMRQILIDEIRKQRSAKRQAPSFATAWPAADGGDLIDLELLDAALKKLEGFKPDHASLVDRRFFAGLTLEEIAIVDGVSLSTIKRQWRAVRTWLVSELSGA
jgi:RNA polymerase sigma factor (TIGR02999 family)